MSAGSMARIRRPRRLVRRVAFASIVAAGVLSSAAHGPAAPAIGGAPMLAQATIVQAQEPSPRRAAAASNRRSSAANRARRARTPQTDAECFARGEARWYGGSFNGRRTASGEVFNMNRMTAASRSVPFGTWVRVTRLDNGRSVVVKVNDRHAERPGLVIDLSRAAAQQIGMVGSGVARVCLTRADPPRRATSSARVAERSPARASSRNGASSTRRR